ncbi:MAG: CpcT/CpeT family chromophore lyase [Steroidobacteraceae bacterium]|nr:CpcT/CpeT family chromophore lyase [Steroidobacteraceae bacterium]
MTSALPFSRARLACLALALGLAPSFVFAAPPPAPGAPSAQAAPTTQAMIEQIATRWTGSFDNHRQVAANLERGAPAAPELTRERRTMQVLRLDSPQLGEVVLYYEEFRDTQPGKAHRQRVVSLVADAASGQVRAKQLFFDQGPAYDREPLTSAAVAKLPPSSFRHEANCDLYFTWQAAQQRYRGSMRPRTCVYPHPVDGMVYAEFDMLLYPDQLWYRDRSLRVADGSIRGEIDGFSWLLFDRAAPPAIARQQGVWKGTFRRYDADGRLAAEFPSEIVTRVENRDGQLRYRQTNRYSPAGAPPQVIESSGVIRGGRIEFANERLTGWSMDVPGDASGRSSVLVMQYQDGSGLVVHEIISLSEDGRRRSRAAQYLEGGRLLRRTLIDEVKATDDWAGYDAAR